MALFDVYKVTDIQNWLGQLMLNVYFYQIQSAVSAPVAVDVANAIIGQLIPTIKHIQTAGLVHSLVKTENLFDPSDVDEQVISIAGSSGGSGGAQPAFGAVGFRISSSNGALRSAAKRYAGLTENEVTDGVITDSGYIASLVDVQDVLTETLDEGIIPTYVPVVVGRILDGGQYRLPTSLGEAVLGSLVEAIYNPLMTSQVSRKIGRGV